MDTNLILLCFAVLSAAAIITALLFRILRGALSNPDTVNYLEFNKLSPVSYPINLDEHLKIAVLTPTQDLFDLYIHQLPAETPGKMSDFVRVSNFDDLNNIYFKQVLHGLQYHIVPFDVRLAAENRLINNVEVSI